MTNANFAPCHDWLEQLAKPIGDLSSSERVELEAHVASCTSCRVRQLDYQMISDLIRSLPAPDFPPGLPPRLQQLLREEQESADNVAIPSISLTVDNSTLGEGNYMRVERKEPAISVSPTEHSLSDAKSQDTTVNEYPDTVRSRQSIGIHLSLLLRGGAGVSGQHHPLRWLVALTIGPVVNIYCEIYRRLGIQVYFDRVLVCRDCKQLFLFTAGEQRFYQQQNLTQQPRRCPACRVAARQAAQKNMPAAVQETQTCHNEILHS